MGNENRKKSARGVGARLRGWFGLGPVTKPATEPVTKPVASPAAGPAPGTGRAAALAGPDLPGKAKRSGRKAGKSGAGKSAATGVRPAGPGPARVGKAGAGKAGIGKTGTGKRRARRRPPVPPIGDFVLILGAMKSGTTSLYDYLATHPEIAPCIRKEPSFFAADRRKKTPGRYYRLWPGYDPARHRYAMEASVDYTKQPRYRYVTRWIRDFPARFKFIYIVRDPVDRIESQIAHNIAKGRITRETYGTKLDSAISTSRYGYQLDAFRGPLGNPEVLLLDFDELRRDPMALLARVVDFLGIDPGFTFAERAASNTRKAVNDSESFRLSRAERGRFRAKLAPDMAHFARDYGFDITRWGFPAPPPEPLRLAERRDTLHRRHLGALVDELAAKSRRLIEIGTGEGIAPDRGGLRERVLADPAAPGGLDALDGGRRFDFALCPALEQAPDPEALARKLLASADRVLVSLPGSWDGPERWFGREPDYRVLIEEPGSSDPAGRRLIAYYHNTGTVPPGQAAPRKAAPKATRKARPDAGPDGDRAVAMVTESPSAADDQRPA
ncbi:sulfotransferase [Amaricoccus sp. W119]|uniref:sulfotransferase family protein n=1 Tax=Amaricoccus sp. W119 TaxID=3391833 RepID=UPI0039A53C90